jgi:hypothetical protein
MADDTLNMSMRKFLKQVGVTSQQAIENGIREAGGLTAPVKARVVLEIEELGVTHEINGVISPGENP